MKNLNKAILIALGMSIPLGVMASPDDDVTIRMMEASEHATEAVTRHIELPEAADDRAKEHASRGLETANKSRDGDHGDMDSDRDHDMDGEDRDHEMDREEDHEREMDREEEHEREMDRDDRNDAEHGGRDREELEREGFDDIDHGGDSRPELEGPGSDFEAPGQGTGSSHGPK